MSRLRPALRPLSGLAMCAFLLGSSLPVWDEHPMGSPDDAACQVTTAWESVDHPHIGAAPPAPDQPAHCVYCHLQRAMSGAATAHPPALLAPALAMTVLSIGESAMLAAPAPARPSRAPPAFPSI